MSVPRPHGQDEALATLRRLASSQARTFLFAGPDGVGRRLAARWLTALLNCTGATAGADGTASIGTAGAVGATEPCGSCPACRLWDDVCDELVSIRDYREVAAPATTRDGRPARHRQVSIDQLVPRRDGDPDPLGPWLVAPPSGRVRVGVIDDADQLGEAAANAFLKTLEEPPEHARIVLVAPGPDTVLATVASRCTVVRFRPVMLDAATRERLGPHPAVRLGTPAALRAAHADEGAARAAVDDLVAALGDSLAATFAALPAFQEAWPAGDALVPGLLRERARSRGPATYLAFDAALEAAETASAAYAHRGLLLKRLALALRQAWRGPPEPPLA